MRHIEDTQNATLIYDPKFLQDLFDEMQNTYERVSTLCSFGFNRRWCSQLVSRMKLHAGMSVCDLMAGTGESWSYVLPQLGQQGEVIAVDFSPVMAANARRRAAQIGGSGICVLQEDALYNSVAAGSVDAVLCVYGTKTLASHDDHRFVCEVQRLLKPGGLFGLVEVSVPPSPLLRFPYLFYLTYIVPLVGKLFLGNPSNYRMLSRYTIQFGNCSRLSALFTANGFEVRQFSFFWGCATALIGTKMV